jgi:hypothetical protein
MQFSPFKYQTKLRDELKAQTKTWEWFSSVKVKVEQLQDFKTNLLKNAYRLEKEQNAELYDKVNLTKEKLGLSVDVTLYQAQNTIECNAGISYSPGEAHIVFSGPILKLLSGNELLSVIAHELSHLSLFSIENTEYEITDRIITSIANDRRTDDVYIETARLYKLYMELYCDRGSLFVTGNIETVLSGLIKINTGLEKVSVPSYLKQVDEILAIDNLKAENETHPENYIRVKALNLWHIEGEKSELSINKIIEGEMNLASLDIFKQEKLKDLTFELIKIIIKPKWIRTTELMSLAQQYQSEFIHNDNIEITEELVNKIGIVSKSVKEYFSYILLDFALVDPSLKDLPMGVAFQLAENLGLKEYFNEAVKKELKLTSRKLLDLQNKTTKALAEVKESKDEHIYNE